MACGLFDEESDIINYTGVIAAYDSIRIFIERELLLTTDEKEIRAYRKILTHVKEMSKAVVEGGDI